MYWKQRKSEAVLVHVKGEGSFNTEKTFYRHLKKLLRLELQKLLQVIVLGSIKQQRLAQNSVQTYFLEYVGMPSRDGIRHFSNKQERLSRCRLQPWV